MQLLHNPRCSKSRDSFNWLTENGHLFETLEYLKNPLTKEELEGIVDKLGISPKELIRTGEADYKANFKDKDLSDSEWIEAMLKYPKLIERPILIKGNQAVIGRPLERVIDLAKK